MTAFVKAFDLMQRYDLDELYTKFYEVAIDDFAGRGDYLYEEGDSDEVKADKDRSVFNEMVDSVFEEIFSLQEAEDQEVAIFAAVFINKYYSFIR